jgi:hypothetical protein
MIQEVQSCRDYICNLNLVLYFELLFHTPILILCFLLENLYSQVINS